MWSRRAALAALAALAACGFEPVYGPGGGGAALRGAIRATEPDTDLTFAFVRQLEERIGRPESPRYDLDYTIETVTDSLAIDGSNNITRFNIEGALVWRLVPVGATVPVLSGREAAFTAYSATGSTISTLESERDATRRLAVILADKVVTRLLAEASGLTP